LKKIIVWLLSKIRTKTQLLSKRHYSRIAPKAWQHSPDYESYLQTQLRRTLSKKNAPLPNRARILIDTVSEFVDLGQSDVLCIGSRNTAEIDYFRHKGAKHVIGIDLYSEDEAILVMDMHDMTFPGGSFDVIYSSHSLEHAFDVRKVVSEIVRVARSNAVVAIEVPVAYETRGADLVDFRDLKTLHYHFEPYIAETLWSERQPPHTPTNDSGHSVVRTLFRLGNEQFKSEVLK
jgi:SAM-dependent methyltransferase